MLALFASSVDGGLALGAVGLALLVLIPLLSPLGAD